MVAVLQISSELPYVMYSCREEINRSVKHVPSDISPQYSDQAMQQCHPISLRVQHEETLHPWPFTMHPVKTLTRLRQCWAFMSEGTFSHIAAELMNNFRSYRLHGDKMHLNLEMNVGKMLLLAPWRAMDKDVGQLVIPQSDQCLCYRTEDEYLLSTARPMNTDQHCVEALSDTSFDERICQITFYHVEAVKYSLFMMPDEV